MSVKLREFTVDRCEGREFLETLGARPARIEDEDDADWIEERRAACEAWLAVNPAAATRARRRVELHALQLFDELVDWANRRDWSRVVLP